MFPANLVKLEHERFIVDMMYARADNMVSRAVYQEIGFGNQAWAHPELAAKIMQLVPWLQQNHRKLKICDAYRPPVAHRLLKEIIPQPGFFASEPARSQHCHGTAVDLLLCDENGNELAYPTLVDAYDPSFAAQVRGGEMEPFMAHLQKARHDYAGATPEEINNRHQLKELMEGLGLESISFEWWHYDLPDGRNEARYPMIELDLSSRLS